MNRFNRKSATHAHTCVYASALLCAQHQPFTPQKIIYIYVFFYYIWIGQGLAGICCMFSKWICILLREICLEPRLEPATSKHRGFQRLSFTANFSSLGSYVSRRHINGCFHHHFPIQHPKSLHPQLSERTLIPCLLSPPTWTFSEYFWGKKCSHPTLPLDLVSPESWLDTIWGCSLKSAPLSFLILCSWSVLASWHRTHCGYTLMEWTWISPSIVGDSYMWRAVVCYFNRYEKVDRETRPSRTWAGKIDRSLWIWLWLST